MSVNNAHIRIIADDAAQNSYFDEGILKLAEKGILTGISAFSTYNRLKIFASTIPSDIKLGIHLNFSSGKPLSDPKLVPTLVDSNGYFHCPTPSKEGRIEGSIEEFLSHQVPRMKFNDIKTETKAQIDAFHNDTGNYPSFSCIHHDLDNDLFIRDEINRIIPAIPSRQMRLHQNKLGGLFTTLLNSSDSITMAINYVKNMITNAIKCSIHNKGLLYEIVCHPGEKMLKNNGFTVYQIQRHIELKVWLSKDIIKLFSDAYKKDGDWIFNRGSIHEE